MKLFIPILFLSILSTLFAQDKYFIYFTDKGAELAKSGMEYSQAYKIVSGYVTERAIERRKKTLNNDDVIDFADMPINANYLEQLENIGVKPLRELRWFNAISAHLTTIQKEQVSNLPFVKKITPVKKLRGRSKLLPPADRPVKKSSSTNYELDYGFSLPQNELSQIPAVHDKGFNGADVLIGILDTGFDWGDHEALSSRNVVGEYDFVQDDNVTKNQTGDSPSQHNHGTYVFSILAGYAEGMLVGPAYNASFMLAKTENVSGETHAEEDDYAAAMEWFENNGVDITTSSLGYSEFDEGENSYTYQNMDGNTTIVAQAAKTAFSKGVVTVTSAGNEGNSSWYYITSPADEQNIISVGALTADNNVASFSSRGPTPDGRIKPEISTMGVSVFGVKAAGDYEFASGTSSAAPITAGITALLLDAFPHLTNRQVRKIILEAGDNVEAPDNDRGYGLLSATGALGFPNLKFENSEVIVNKIFFDNELNSTIAPKIYYSTDGVNFLENELSTADSKIFNYNFGNLTSEDTIRFHFTYKRNDNTEQRVPSAAEYKFVAGSDMVSLITGLETRPTIAENFYLFNNFPNPFNISTTIEFYTEYPVDVDLIIYDALGQKVRTLYAGTSNQGYNTFVWNGKNELNNVVSSGIYYYILKSGDRFKTNKMILLK